MSASYSNMPELVQAFGVNYNYTRKFQETGDVFSMCNKPLSISS